MNKPQNQSLTIPLNTHSNHVFKSHYPVLIVGGGQSGLSASYYLQQCGIEHLVLEKNQLVHSWKQHRWDAFSLVTPNWQCQLPGHPYDGDDPHGFMTKPQIIDYLNRFIAKVNAPVLEGVAVQAIQQDENALYHVQTTAGQFTASQVIVASGGYHLPIIPTYASQIDSNILQIHSEQYKNPQQLPAGAVLVVGSGQSGAQIAEDLHLAGKKVYLATGEAPRCARFYRGRDVVDWLHDMKYYDLPVEQHPLREGVRDNTNHYVTGRDGGRDIDLRNFALQGMQLFGLLQGYADGSMQFSASLQQHLDQADAVYNRINKSIDDFIEKHGIDAPAASVYQPVWQPQQEHTSLNLQQAGISSIIWCIGFRPDFSWLQVDNAFNERAYPLHLRGISPVKGLYFLGLPWLHTWGSGRFSGIARDAKHVVQHISLALGNRLLDIA